MAPFSAEEVVRKSAEASATEHLDAPLGSRSSTKELYIIMLVSDPLACPRIVGLIMDPGSLLLTHELQLAPVSYRVGCKRELLTNNGWSQQQ